MGSITVTPGTTVNAATVIDAGVLNALATPVAALVAGSVTAADIDTVDLLAELGDSFRSVNYLPQGAFDFGLFRSAASQSCAVGVVTYVHRDWWVKSTGVGVTAIAIASTPNDRSDIALKITGDTGLTELEIGTWVPPEITGLLKASTVVVSAYFYNNTGASITPELVIRGATTSGVPALTGAGVDYAGSGAAANGAWTRISFSLSTGAVTNWLNGAQLSFKLSASDLPLAGEHVIVAEVAMEITALTSSWVKPVPVLPQVPPGTLLPYAGPSTKIPAGWLLCDGTGYAATTYPRLYEAIGTAYGSSGGFQVPDMRGRAFVGAEVTGAIQSRLEVSMSGTTVNASTSVTVTSTAGLRLGMGVFGDGINTGAYITGLTSTVITLSAAATASATVDLRFSKLGASADAETVGASGDGMSYGRNEVKLTKKGCSTATSTTLTVPNITGLACGMTVSSSAADIPAGTTIDAILSTTTVKLSATATGTNSGQTVTFGVDAPEGNQYEKYLYLQKNVKLLCVISQAADTQLQHPVGLASLLETGMSITGEAASGIQAGTYLASFGSTPDFDLSTPTVGASVTSHYLTFSAATLTRTGTPTPDTLPAATGNWIIKH